MNPNSRDLKITSILDMVVKAKTKEERMQILRRWNCLALRDILQGAFDEAIVWQLPKGVPPYKKLDIDRYPVKYINRATKRLAYFVNGSSNFIENKIKREKFFIETLESVHPEDAELIIKMKDKDLSSYKGLTKKLVCETFPNLIIK